MFLKLAKKRQQVYGQQQALSLDLKTLLLLLLSPLLYQ